MFGVSTSAQIDIDKTRNRVVKSDQGTNTGHLLIKEQAKTRPALRLVRFPTQLWGTQ